MARAKVIYFDYGGVLATSGAPGDFQSALIQAMGLPLDKIYIADLLDELKRGRMEFDEFADAMNKRYKEIALRPIDESVWKTMEWITIGNDQAYSFAKRCMKAGLKVGILSNVYPASARWIEEQGNYDGFDPVLLSCDEGYAKPDPEFYALAEAKAGVKPEEIVLVDDQDKCIIAAEERGWQTIRVHNTEQMCRDLCTLLGWSETD